MKVAVHPFTDQLNLHTLSVRAAAGHAQAAIRCLENLRCPKTQKLELIQRIHAAVGALAESSTSSHEFRPPPKKGRD